jgi:hypothetical protein
VGKTWEKIQLAARIIVTIENPSDVIAISARPYAQRAVLKYAHYTGAVVRIISELRLLYECVALWLRVIIQLAVALSLARRLPTNVVPVDRRPLPAATRPVPSPTRSSSLTRAWTSSPSASLPVRIQCGSHDHRFIC